MASLLTGFFICKRIWAFEKVQPECIEQVKILKAFLFYLHIHKKMARTNPEQLAGMVMCSAHTCTNAQANIALLLSIKLLAHYVSTNSFFY